MIRGQDIFAAAPSLDMDGLRRELTAAVERGALGAGMAHRVLLAAQLTRTLQAPDARTRPTTLSGEDLGRSAGVSRAAVHKHVHRLRSQGFSVRSLPGAGYVLERSFNDLVAAEAVLPLLLGAPGRESKPGSRPDAPRDEPPARAWKAGVPYDYLPRCRSTNALVKEAVERGSARSAAGRQTQGTRPPAAGERPVPGALPAGALVVTDEQTEGRGRLGRGWLSERGRDLTFSVLLRPSLGPVQSHLLSLAAALAVAEVLETLPGLENQVAVKWPNDVLLGGKKVCGILLEGSIDVDRLHWAVAGIGLNVNSCPSEWEAVLGSEQAEGWKGRPLPVSLRECLGREVPRGPLLAALLERLTGRWHQLEERGVLSSGQGIGPAGPGAFEELAGEELAGAARVVASLRRRDALFGRQVEILAGPDQPRVTVAGEAMGIGPEGQLLVRRPSGEEVGVFAGDVTVRDVNR